MGRNAEHMTPRALDLLAKATPDKPRKPKTPQTLRIPGIGKCRITARNGEWLRLAASDGEPFVRHISEIRQ